MTETTEEITDPRPWEGLEQILESQNGDAVKAFLSELTPGDAARCLDRLEEGQRQRVLELLDLGTAAELIGQLPEAQGGGMLESVAPKLAADIIGELPSDHRADMITALEPESAASILAEMKPEVAREATELASYAPDTAGGLMVREYLAYRQDATAGDVVSDLRRRVDAVADYQIQYIYVTDANGRLTGVLRLRDLLVTPGQRPLQRFMIADPVSVHVDDDLDQLADVFEARTLLGVPVVNAAGVLLGVVHRSDVDEAWDDRAESNRLKAQGIVGGEELRSMPLLLRARRRLSWLSVNILLNLCAASVVAAYQDTLQAAIALAVFLPIISDMSGCSGNQAVAVSMRELTLGIVKPLDVLYVWRKELMVGAINGVALGLLLAGTAWLWKGNPMLGVVAGGALALNTLVAVSIGGSVPLVLKRLGMDPALAAGPILTTLTDMCGFFLVLSIATALMSHLVPPA